MGTFRLRLQDPIARVTKE